MDAVTGHGSRLDLDSGCTVLGLRHWRCAGQGRRARAAPQRGRRPPEGEGAV